MVFIDHLFRLLSCLRTDLDDHYYKGEQIRDTTLNFDLRA